MARALALSAALAVAVLALSGAGGAATQQAPKRGGMLAIRVLGPEPACLNVLLDPCFSGVVDAVLERPYEVLPNFTYRSQLAKATFTRRRPFTLTYRIDPDARWSDGVPITSADFVFTLHAIRRYGYRELRDLHAVVRSISAVDPKTFKVVLRPRSSVWQQLFDHVLPAHVLRGTDLSDVWTTSIDNPKTGEPIGSGPFLVERWDRGRQLVLRRNPRFWGPHPSYLDRITVSFAATALDPTEELKSGALDVAEVPFTFISSIRKQRGIGFTARPSPAIEHLEFQRGADGNPALDNKLVRRAIAYGIDREQIVRAIWGPVDPTLRALDSLVLVTQSPAYAAAWSSYRYRPDHARQLLEQAECRRGPDGIYSCAGKRLSLRFVASSGFTIRQQVLALVQAQLRRVGVEVLPVFVAQRAFFTQILPDGLFDVALLAWAYFPGESWSAEYGCRGTSNYAHYCQRLVTANLDQAGRILDPLQQARVLNRADAQMSNDVPALPLYQQVAAAAFRTEVHNYVLNPATFDDLWNAVNWWKER